MELNMRMVALGDMGKFAGVYEWRGNAPILRLVRMFGGNDPDCDWGLDNGQTQITMDTHALHMMVRYLSDPVLSLHLWEHTGDREYYDDIISPIMDQFLEAMGIAETECIDFYFYARVT